MFHGPTLAFKDVAMQILGRLYTHILAARARTMTIVCATSGDTGGAAVEAFAGLDHVRVVVLFPEGRISEVQRRFMTTAHQANVRTVAVAGDFDDCQAILKALFQDEAFAREVDLSAVNSINFARIVAQSVYFFTAAVALGAPARKVDFAVPTGNFGDAFAGYAAWLMGLPIGRIIVATNANDIVARALRDRTSTAGAMPGDPKSGHGHPGRLQLRAPVLRVRRPRRRSDGRAFRAFAERRRAPHTRRRAGCHARGVCRGGRQTRSGPRGAIADDLPGAGELIDPHTAVAIAGADGVGPSACAATPLVVISTAHPGKVPRSGLGRHGRRAASAIGRARRAGLPERIDHLPAEVEAIKRYVRAFAAS